MVNMDVASLAAGLCRQLVTTIYPPCCVLCGSTGIDDRDICAACYRNLPWIEAACSQCALPLAKGGIGGIRCGQCLRRPPAFDRSISLFSYRNDAIKLIQQLKFNEKLANSRLLGSLLVDAVQTNGAAVPDCIVPIPLHRKRLRQRGFNQSIELARPAGKALNVPVNVACA